MNYIDYQITTQWEYRLVSSMYFHDEYDSVTIKGE